MMNIALFLLIASLPRTADCRTIQKSAEVNDGRYYFEGFCGGSVWGIGKYEGLWDGGFFIGGDGDYASDFYSS